MKFVYKTIRQYASTDKLPTMNKERNVHILRSTGDMTLCGAVNFKMRAKRKYTITEKCPSNTPDANVKLIPCSVCLYKISPDGKKNPRETKRSGWTPVTTYATDLSLPLCEEGQCPWD
jgi:hypothetical protein